MDSQDKDPAILKAPVVIKNNKLAILFACLFGIALIFGILAFMKYMEKDSEVSKLKNGMWDSTTVTRTTSDTISINEANKILAKYIGEQNNILAHTLGSYYSTFADSFDENNKAFHAYAAITHDSKSYVDCDTEWYEKGACTQQRINFSDLDKKYKELFGEYGAIEKTNYNFKDFYYLVYDSDIDGFREYILPGGGTTGIKAFHKTVEVEKAGDDMVVTLLYGELNTDVAITSDVCGPALFGGVVSEEDLQSLISSLTRYEFTLSPYDGSYVLTGVKKVDN